MDLGAYLQIEDYEYILREQNIEVPRLRGLRLMSEEKPISAERTQETINCETLYIAKHIIEQHSLYNFKLWGYPRQKKKLIYKRDESGKDYDVVGIRWEGIHGKERRWIKYEIKKMTKRAKHQDALFNKFAGRPDVLYVHCRNGIDGWTHENAIKLMQNPYFLGYADDAYDGSYCDIYFKIEDRVLNLIKEPSEEIELER